jgi:hypothetical protein
MRMRDVLQLLKNVTSNVTVQLDGATMLPGLELSGKGILDLHANSIWIANVVGDAFLKPRIMWEDFNHEFHFVHPAERGTVCRDALLMAATALREVRIQVAGHTSAEFAVVDLLVAMESVIDVAARNVLVSRDEYNAWVINTGGNADEKMSEDEHLAALVDIIRNVRRDTYPLWYSLIDLLPEGVTKTQAEQKLKQGCKTVEMDTGDITPNWQIVSAQNS